MEQPAHRIVLRDSLAELDRQSEWLAALDAAVAEQSGVLSEPMQKVVAALVCLYGVQELTAVTVVAETGDLGRFAKAPQLFSYAGVVPKERFSGGPDKSRRGGIPKTGNAHLRRVLVAAAWHHRHPPKVIWAISRQVQGSRAAATEPPEVRAV